MRRILKFSDVAYLIFSLLMYSGLALLLKNFYTRRLNADENVFNPSIIERFPVENYKIAISVSISIALLLGIILLGRFKKLMVAKVFFVLVFILQTTGIVIAGLALKEIEGVYFWESDYVQKYFYMVGAISIFSILVLSKWLSYLLPKRNIDSNLDVQ